MESLVRFDIFQFCSSLTLITRFLDMHMYITSALQKTDMKAVGLQLALELLHQKVPDHFFSDHVSPYIMNYQIMPVLIISSQVMSAHIKDASIHKIVVV